MYSNIVAGISKSTWQLGQISLKMYMPDILNAPVPSQYASTGGGYKLVVKDQSNAPIKRISLSQENLTFSQFKRIASSELDLTSSNYKFYVRSHDEEFGFVKEEVLDDDFVLPIINKEVIVWVIKDEDDEYYDSSEQQQRNPLVFDDTNDNIYENDYDAATSSNQVMQVKINLAESNSLTFTVIGSHDQTKRGMYITGMDNNPSTGQLEIGDKVVSINGTRIYGDKTQMTNGHLVYSNKNQLVLGIEKNCRRPGFYGHSSFTIPRSSVSNQYNHFVNESHSLTRSITPPYTSFNLNNGHNSNSARLDSQSNNTKSSREVKSTLHCSKNDMSTVYEALLEDSACLDIKDRQWLKVRIENAFIGASLVQWLKNNVYGFDQKEDIKRYAYSMLQKGFIQSPVSAKKFSEKSYYVIANAKIQRVQKVLT